MLLTAIATSRKVNVLSTRHHLALGPQFTAYTNPIQYLQFAARQQYDPYHVACLVLDQNPPSFAGAVVEILNSALPQASTFSPPHAAKSLNELSRPFLDASNAESQCNAAGFLWWFWQLIHDLSRQIPHDSLEQDRLVAIIKELRDLPSKTIILDGWGPAQVWAGLPLFGSTLREEWDSDGAAPMDSDLKQRFLNLHSYAARIAGLGLVSLECYAIWALTDALEGVMTPIRGAPDEVNPNPAAVEDLPFKVAAAAEWIFHAGHVLYARDEEVYGTAGGPLWRLDKAEARRLRRKYRGTQGLCPARWTLWKQRFSVIRDSREVDQGTRIVAGRAYGSMEIVESAEWK